MKKPTTFKLLFIDPMRMDLTSLRGVAEKLPIFIVAQDNLSTAYIVDTGIPAVKKEGKNG